MQKNMKKTILVTTLSTVVLILVLFIVFKSYNYVQLKNACINNIVKPGGHSVSLFFDPKTSQVDIDKFAVEIKKINGVTDTVLKSKDEALQEFNNMQGNNPSINQALNEIGGNPLSTQLTVNSNISDIDTFLKFEQNVLDKAKGSGLIIAHSDDGMLKFYQKEQAKVKSASLIKDLPSFMFSSEGSHYLEKYSSMCNPNTLRK
jgi:hypothetical protein